MRAPILCGSQDTGKNTLGFQEIERAFSSSFSLTAKQRPEAAGEVPQAAVPEQRGGEMQPGMKTFGPNISSILTSQGQNGLADLWPLGTFTPDQPSGK